MSSDENSMRNSSFSSISSNLSTLTIDPDGKITIQAPMEELYNVLQKLGLNRSVPVQPQIPTENQGVQSQPVYTQSPTYAGASFTAAGHFNNSPMSTHLPPNSPQEQVASPSFQNSTPHQSVPSPSYARPVSLASATTAALNAVPCPQPEVVPTSNTTSSTRSDSSVRNKVPLNSPENISISNQSNPVNQVRAPETATEIVHSQFLLSETATDESLQGNSVVPATETEDDFLTEENYLEILDLYNKPIWPTFAPFDCPTCGIHVGKQLGIKIKNCMIHNICRECLTTHIIESNFKEILCPLAEPSNVCGDVSESEIKALLSAEEWIQYQSKPNRIDAENDISQLQMYLTDHDLVPNLYEVDCPVCMERVPAQAGVMPKNCMIHIFCKDCLKGAINHSDIPLVQCPAGECDANLTDREVRILVSDEEYLALHAKGVKRVLASAGAETLQCLTPDCAGIWYISDVGDGRFTCPVCKATNCSKCKVIHTEDQTCAQYQEDKRIKEQNNNSEVETKAYLEQCLKAGKAMICPKCGAIVSKKDGCDGMQCTICSSHLCWATKKLRWGPAGRGDWSGGCKCMMNGKRCSPNCQNCH